VSLVVTKALKKNIELKQCDAFDEVDFFLFPFKMPQTAAERPQEAQLCAFWNILIQGE